MEGYKGCLCKHSKTGNCCLSELTHSQTSNKIKRNHDLHEGNAAIKKMRLEQIIEGGIEQTLREEGKTLADLGPKITVTYSDMFYGNDGEEGELKSFCEGCLYELHDVSRRTGERSKSYVKSMLAMKKTVDLISQKYGYVKAKKRKNNVEQEGRFFKNILQARKFFRKAKKNGMGEDLVMDEYEMKELCVPGTAGSMECFYWLNEFFDINCDRPPNKTENRCELPASTYSKLSIYNLYKKHCQMLIDDSQKPISVSSFYKLWRNIFPNVVIVRYLAVSGKCSICAEIYAMDEQCSTLEHMEDLMKIKIYHRQYVQSFKKSYYDHRRLAQLYPEQYMSLISDGMQQDHTKNPYFANQKTNSTVVSQHIQGIKDHFLGKAAYRSFPHVEGGFNINAHVILCEIMKRLDYCLEKDICFPRTLFLQVDGGAENTAKAMFGLCEFLVDMEVFDKIELSRLPVGHTHEDIDAMFGTIWTHLRRKTLLSPEEFKIQVMQAFKISEHTFTKN